RAAESIRKDQPRRARFCVEREMDWAAERNLEPVFELLANLFWNDHSCFTVRYGRLSPEFGIPIVLTASEKAPSLHHGERRDLVAETWGHGCFSIAAETVGNSRLSIGHTAETAGSRGWLHPLCFLARPGRRQTRRD